MSAKTSEKKGTSGKLAVVLVRGLAQMSRPLQDTLQLLRLQRKNHAVVVADSPALQGMIQKVKDYVTWGEIDEATFTELLQKRGLEYQARLTDAKQKYSYKVLQVGNKVYKPYFRLNPPRGGFERKGIKIAFAAGGALGYRGEKINALIKKML